MTFFLEFVPRNGGVAFAVKRGETVRVGRKGDVDVRLDHVAVGSRQCVIDFSSDPCRIRDAGSPGGTWLNHRQVLKTAEVNPGDVVNLGGLEFVVEQIRKIDHGKDPHDFAYADNNRNLYFSINQAVDLEGTEEKVLHGLAFLFSLYVPNNLSVTVDSFQYG